jgi:hypothetical protein
MVTGQLVPLMHGKKLSMWIQESITVSPLRYGQDIFHQNFADPHGFEGEVKITSYKLTQTT